MFFPLSHQEQQARRWPWVTTVIIALNLFLHALLWSTSNADEKRLTDAYRDAVAFAQRHPQRYAMMTRAAALTPAAAEALGVVTRALAMGLL